jgi:hypothetical protein
MVVLVAGMFRGEILFRLSRQLMLSLWRCGAKWRMAARAD